jgi:predicted lipoprotein
MKRFLPVAGVFVAAGAVCWLVPPFHLISLDEASANQGPVAESAAEFVEKFWETELAAALANAADAANVLASLRDDVRRAEEQYGRSVGLSRKYYFFVRGEGRVVSVDRTAVGVALTDDGEAADVLLQRGHVFGNAVRDATGLLNPSDYTNSQQFNDVSSELNRIVEARVLPALFEQSEIGRTVRFVGCAEAETRAGAVQLKTIPLEVEFK